MNYGEINDEIVRVERITMKAGKEELLTRKVWIWSARNNGPIAAKFILINGGDVIGFIDNSEDIQGELVLNIPVWRPEDVYKKITDEEIVLCCCNEKNNKSIVDQLAEHNIKNNVRELDLWLFDGIQQQFGGFLEEGYEPRMVSKCCSEMDFSQDYFKRISSELSHQINDRLHRKTWEFVYIIKALEDHGLLREGKTGIGFAVGEEPLPSYFASKGVAVLATDLGMEADTAKAWAETSENALGDVNKLYKESIVSREVFERNVKYMDLDMNHIPDDIGTFDFCWSSCAIEHVGGLNQSKQFLKNMIKVLKPGGIAVHTTEFNLWSNDETEEYGYQVIYRRKDLEEIQEWLLSHGCEMELSFKRSRGSVDMYLPMPPYPSEDKRHHLNLLVGMVKKFASTSFGLIIKKKDKNVREEI